MRSDRRTPLAEVVRSAEREVDLLPCGDALSPDVLPPGWQWDDSLVSGSPAARRDDGQVAVWSILVPGKWQWGTRSDLTNSYFPQSGYDFDSACEAIEAAAREYGW